MAEFKRTLVTAALPYANGPLHVGHVAGAYLPADLYCRYLRLTGEDVVFICGSDEHGVPIILRARDEGKSPRDVVDHYHELIKTAFSGLQLSFDYYGRTSSSVHADMSQDFFRRLNEVGALKIRSSKQLFDPEANMFLADRFVIGTCPNCGYEEAFGDQCERCGISLSPLELIDPRSTITRAEPVLKETTHWYLPLGEFQKELSEWIKTHDDWKSNVLGQVRSWLNEGLKDRAVTRDLPWGVPVPEDVAAAADVDSTGKVLYVWLDAPIGYISATKEWAEEQGDPDRWKTYWQSSDTRLIHFIGKDNIVFHCLIFPAMLMAHEDYVLPDNVPANEFLNLEGRKLSTSRNWAVWVHEYLGELPADQLRYTLASTLPETKDADFSWAEYQSRSNSELADILGNFVHRTMTFATRYFDGKVPPLVDPTRIDRDLLTSLQSYPERIGASYRAFRFREAVFETMSLARDGNKYFNDTEPWKTAKSDPKACANTIHISLQLCASLSILFAPVIPEASVKLQQMLNLTGQSTGDAGREPAVSWSDAARPLLEVGHKLGSPEPLFEKVEDSVVEAQRARLGAADAESHDVATKKRFERVKEQIVFDDFTKIDLRVGTVLEAAPLEGADKLLKLRVDVGFEERQIVAGLAQHVSAKDLIGRKVVVVVNLQPRTIRGAESQGMLLAAESPEGELSIVNADAENGSVVR